MTRVLTPEQIIAEEFAFSTPGQPTNPEQWEAFFLAWEERIKVKIGRYGFDEDETEDVFQELMLIWIQRDYLSTYDRSRGVPYTGFVYGYIEANIKRFLSKKFKHENRHEYIPTYSTDRDADHDKDWILSDDALVVEIPEPSQSVQSAVDFLARKPKNNTQDLRWLFLALLKQIETTGKIKQADIAKALGITDRAVGHQMTNLRERLIKSGLVTFDARGIPRWQA